MIFVIDHHISYSYSAPVFLEPHTIRLHPRNDPCQEALDCTLTVNPQPEGINHFLDPEGNRAAVLWFAELTEQLVISASSTVRTLCANPYTYLVTDDAFLQMPVRYAETEAAALAPCLAPIAMGARAEAFAMAALAGARGSTLDFLNRLCTAVYEHFTVVVRDHGPVLPPEVIMEKRQGACRDLAYLFIALCRRSGLAARFVSGYEQGDEEMLERHLHAWAEVFIPGGGWRGYDPTHGLAVAEGHIVLAASHHPDGAAPVSGTFRGTDVTTAMEYRIGMSAREG